MKNITIKDNEGNSYAGSLPEGWQEVTLATWLHYAKQKETKPESLDQVLLVSSLTKLPVAILQEDTSLVTLILNQMTWVATMPDPKPVPSFLHMEQEYEHTGHLEKINIYQHEALCTYLEQAEGNELQAAPALLAVLYKPKGVKQDMDTVRATVEAFQTLPMDKAWSAVALFILKATPPATRIQAYQVSRQKLMQILNTTEQALAPSVPRKRTGRIAAWWGRTYIRSVKKLLRG